MEDASRIPRTAKRQVLDRSLALLEAAKQQRAIRVRRSRRSTSRVASGSVHRGSPVTGKPAERRTAREPHFHRHLDSQRNGEDPEKGIDEFPGHNRYHHHHQGWPQMKSTLRISLKSGERIFRQRCGAARRSQGGHRVSERRDLPPGKPRSPARRRHHAPQAALFHRQMILINPEGAEQSTLMFRKSS